MAQHFLTRSSVEEIGYRQGLSGERLLMFVDFICERFNLELIDGLFVYKWAVRFYEGTEWDCADHQSKAILWELMKK